METDIDRLAWPRTVSTHLPEFVEAI